MCYLFCRWNIWPQPSHDGYVFYCWPVDLVACLILGSYIFFLLRFFFHLKFVSKYIWHLIWRGSLAHAMRTVNTHLSSYLFVFYISWFDTTQHSHSQAFPMDIIIHLSYGAMSEIEKTCWRETHSGLLHRCTTHNRCSFCLVHTCICMYVTHMCI